MTEAVLKIALVADRLVLELPDDEAQSLAVRRELAKCRDRHGGRVLATLRPPRRPRTTGEYSQNHHLNGHITQICEATGNSYDAVKYCVKMIAVEGMGYPFKTPAGRVVPQGERDCDTAECAKLIEAAHVLAAELGIILKE